MTFASTNMNGSITWGSGTWGSNRKREPQAANDLRSALRDVLKTAEIGGVTDVRVLRSERRYAHAHDKVFFLLDTHSIDRDERIVALMIQFEGVDYDLVPASSAAMVSAGAESIWK